MNFLTRPIIAGLIWVLPRMVRAAGPDPDDYLAPDDLVDEIAVGAGYTTGAGLGDSLPVVIANIINLFLSILGVLFLVLLVYGGYLWLIARGDKDLVDKAKSTIKNAVIGLVIILLAYSISRFVVRGILDASFGIDRP
jgi:hypothetical protein